MGGCAPRAVSIRNLKVPSSKKGVNLHMTYKKLLCKGERYRFSG